MRHALSEPKLQCFNIVPFRKLRVQFSLDSATFWEKVRKLLKCGGEDKNKIMRKVVILMLKNDYKFVNLVTENVFLRFFSTKVS